jgi:hypothetical protein
MRRWKERLWPTISDQASAGRAVERAVRITALWAILNFVIGLGSILSPSRVTELQPIVVDGGTFDGEGTVISGFTFFLIGALFAFVAWKIKGMSRGWAQVGLALATIMVLSDLMEAVPSPIVLFMHGLILVYFINAVRATIVFGRLESEQPTEYQGA